MKIRLTIGALATIVIVITTGCTPATPARTITATPNSQIEQDVPLAARTVWNGSYARDIQPIFDQYCLSCHGPSKAENGLRLDGYENTLRGTQFGPVIVPGSVGTSTLAQVIQGSADPRIRMPHEGRRLTKNRIQNILLWIEAGAKNN